MKNDISFTSQEWEKIYRNKHLIIIVDPIGWDKTNLLYSFTVEKINENEFIRRLNNSKTNDISN